MIDIEKALQLLQQDGALSRFFQGFEPREQQQKMMANIINAYNNNEIALIEAGTGTGKSIAYLIPAILWAAQNKECTLISTNTINLQEQLIHKDIPAVTKALNITLKAVLVKGMRNYVCLRKLEDTMIERQLFSLHEKEEIEQIERWSQSTTDGTLSSLSFVPSYAVWDRVCAESDTCTRKKCPYAEKCPFLKARQEANDAQILVVNHSLLFADLSTRAESNNYEDPSVLPKYGRVILDESHNIEDIATHFFASKISRFGLSRIIGRLAAEKNGVAQGKLPLLKEKLKNFYRKNPPQKLKGILNRLEIDLFGLRQEVVQEMHNTFDAFASFIETISRTNSDYKEAKLRLLPVHRTHPYWEEEIVTQSRRLIDVIKRYLHAIYAIQQDIARFGDEKLDEQIDGIRTEVTALANRLSTMAEALSAFISSEEESKKVRWIEAQALKSAINVHLIHADLNVADALAQFLFSKFPTIVLCSATLSTNRTFEFVRERFGLNLEIMQAKKVTENIYESPFDYQKQTLLAIPADVPDPKDFRFVGEATEKIWQAIQASHGNAFVLFTSYTMLKTCYEQLRERLDKNRYHVFKQGDENRSILLEKFKRVDRAVLFGTDSFWEGVDVAGEDLRCVIIVKLPFQVPSEPIIQARTEDITAGGGNAFMDYAVPNAIVKFKQGFGRLIRNKRDRGCIVCLDSRLLTKAYGELFLNSLPNCQRSVASGEQFQQEMQTFYRSTYYLTKAK